MLICVVFLTVPVLAQGKDVKLSSSDITMSEAFREIADQTGYNFGYNSSLLKISKKTVLSETHAPLDQILTELLAGTGYTYVIKNDYIIISQKNEEQRQARTENYETDRLPGKLTVGDSSKTLTFYFRFGKSLLERDYLSNNQSLGELHSILSDRDNITDIIRIDVTGSSSPEGNTAFNERIARDRAAAVKGYVRWRYPHVANDKIFTYSAGEQWDGLLGMVESDPDVPSREEVIRILKLSESGDSKKAKLENLSGGKAMSYMIKNMSRYLRTGVSCIVYFDSPVATEDISIAETTDYPVEIQKPVESVDLEIIDAYPSVDSIETTTPPSYIPAKIKKERGGIDWALKTNLLYNLTLTPNLTAEFSLGRRWSIGAEVIYSWWKFGNRYFNRIQIGGVEVRKWFGKESVTLLHGYYAGVYAMVGTYDIMMGGNKGSLSDFSYSAGITLGYSMPVGRRLNLELGIGLGYFGGKYKKYTYSAADGGCYPWKGDFNRLYVGPTKANVSLVWLLGNGRDRNTNKR